MACIYICDGCGKKADAENLQHGYFKPRSWFQRGDEDGTQVACSRKCIDKAAKKTKKTNVVLPV